MKGNNKLKVLIMSRQEANRHSFKKDIEKTAIISITDTYSENNHFHSNPNIIAILKLKFDDIEKDEKNCVCINDIDAKDIVAFINKLKDKVECIIVHCEAGISRSAGVAGAIMKYLNNDDTPVFNSGRYCPNMTCYRKVLSCFMNGDIDEQEINLKEQNNIDEWKKLNIDINDIL